VQCHQHNWPAGVISNIDFSRHSLNPDLQIELEKPLPQAMYDTILVEGASASCHGDKQKVGRNAHTHATAQHSPLFVACSAPVLSDQTTKLHPRISSLKVLMPGQNGACMATSEPCSEADLPKAMLNSSNPII